MSSRLEKAITQLPPEKIEQVAEFAEALVREQSGQNQSKEFLELGWVGKAADAYPEHESGVEAAHSVGQQIRDALDRASTK
jgi:hypothetical protein